MALSNLDRELLRDCLAKQPDAWENFIDRFLGLVVHVVNHAAAMRDIHLTPELRDDLVADIIMAWIEKDFAVLRRFRGQSSLATYLAIVSRRVVLRRMSHLRLPKTTQSIHLLNIDPADRETNGCTREDLETLEASISELTQSEATAVRMFHFEGKSYGEIATHIGMAENSIGPFLTRARDKMKRSS